jgi:hypothetical protein
MSIGLGIFASVVLILAVYHRGFRKVFLWTAAIAVGLTLLSGAAYLSYDRYITWKAERAGARAKAKDDAAKQAGIIRCMSRLGTPWAANAPPTLPAKYFDNLQACSIAPDDYDPFAEFGGKTDWFSAVNSLPSGYTLDQSNHVVQYAASIPLYDKKGFVPDVLPHAQLNCEDKNGPWLKYSGKAPMCSVVIDGKVAAVISQQEVKDNLAGWMTVQPGAPPPCPTNDPLGLNTKSPCTPLPGRQDHRP